MTSSEEEIDSDEIDSDVEKDVRRKALSKKESQIEMTRVGRDNENWDTGDDSEDDEDEDILGSDIDEEEGKHVDDLEQETDDDDDADDDDDSSSVEPSPPVDKKKVDDKPLSLEGFGLVVKRPQGWSFKGPVPSSRGHRILRAFVWTANASLGLLAILSLQVICLLRNMCFHDDDLTTPVPLSNSIAPIAMLVIFAVAPYGLWTSASQYRKTWTAHIVLSASCAVLLLGMVIYGSIAFLDKIEEKACTLDSYGATCNAWDEATSRQRAWFENDESEFNKRLDENAAASGIFACLGCVLCLVDCIASLVVLVNDPKKNRQDEAIEKGLPE